MVVPLQHRQAAVARDSGQFDDIRQLLRQSCNRCMPKVVPVKVLDVCTFARFPERRVRRVAFDRDDLAVEGVWKSVQGGDSLLG